VSGGVHIASAATRELVLGVGLARLEAFTGRFYAKAFADARLDLFIREHNDPHASRFAGWIFEKLGGGDVWSEERRARATCPFNAHGHEFTTPHDRSSAHYAAWHSPKRSPSDWGNHFNLVDCRTWMRLHFWAMREEGLLDELPAFCDYYVRLIGHFVSVYEREAPPFARESLRWSDPAAGVSGGGGAAYGVAAYVASGGAMADLDPPEGPPPTLAQQKASLPDHERAYTGSKGVPRLWPYAL